jgi:hypothetical protein
MTKGETAPAASPPHYLGHRERLRDRFRKGGADALGEYELLELILFRAMPRRISIIRSHRKSYKISMLRYKTRRLSKIWLICKAGRRAAAVIH